MTTRRAALAQAMRAALVCSAGGLAAVTHADLQNKPKSNIGSYAGADTAQRFFGISLIPETSQRQLRQQLMAGAQP